jgi:hypothetical protein
MESLEKQIDVKYIKHIFFNFLIFKMYGCKMIKSFEIISINK